MGGRVGEWDGKATLDIKTRQAGPRPRPNHP